MIVVDPFRVLVQLCCQNTPCRGRRVTQRVGWQRRAGSSYAGNSVLIPVLGLFQGGAGSCVLAGWAEPSGCPDGCHAVIVLVMGDFPWSQRSADLPFSYGSVLIATFAGASVYATIVPAHFVVISLRSAMRSVGLAAPRTGWTSGIYLVRFRLAGTDGCAALRARL